MESSLQRFSKWLDFFPIAGGFLIADFAYRTFFPDNYSLLTSTELVLGFVTSLSTFWIAFSLVEATSRPQEGPPYLVSILVGTGLNLIVQALLNYFQWLTRSLFLIVIGGVAAGFLLMLLRSLYVRNVADSGVVLVGYDPIAHRLALASGEPVLGVIGDPARCPSSIRFLGEQSQFIELVGRLRPRRILLTQDALSLVPSSTLLSERLQGVLVMTTPDLYEALLQRVYCRGWQPVDLLLSADLFPSSRTLAIQAIYTNLIGLFLLILLSPVLLASSLAVFVFSDRGPILEAVDCSGFRNIPFLLLRFRTRKVDGTGAVTWAGSALAHLRLVNLPQLFNVVRGEMALFGPRPARRQFAQRLTEIMPFYAMRLSVKPGLIGWAPQGEAGSEEFARIESDLYYIKQSSPRLDFEILTKTLFREARHLPDVS